MRIDIVTLFPELCDSFLSASILGRARAKNLFEAHCHQIRDYTKNKQKQTDDYPYGGGCGMVLYAQPIADCLRAVQKEVAEQGRPAPHIVFLTAGGQRYTEEHARRLAQYDNLTLVCGTMRASTSASLKRLQTKRSRSATISSPAASWQASWWPTASSASSPAFWRSRRATRRRGYWDGCSEYPQYTRPEVWEGRAVPDVLLGGDHQKIDAWRGEKSRERDPSAPPRACMSSGARATPSLSCPSGSGARMSASSRRRNSLPLRQAVCGGTPRRLAPETGRKSIVQA